jgi:hypothetical protein
MTAKELMDILNSDDYVEEGPFTHKTLQRIIDAAESLPAEPKPTPSTPERVQIALRRIMNRVEVISKAAEFDVRDSQFIENELLDVWDHHSLKPQPDSSSISTEPMPERFLGDEWIDRVLAEMPGDWNTAQAARELQQWRKWAAAKGQR